MRGKQKPGFFEKTKKHLGIENAWKNLIYKKGDHYCKKEPKTAIKSILEITSKITTFHIILQKPEKAQIKKKKSKTNLQTKHQFLIYA